MKIDRLFRPLALSMMSVCLALACTRPEAAAPATREALEHAHDHPGESDLDRPIEALFGDTCEHGLQTFECDECRYEVGVVKVDASLFEDGLIRTARAVERAVEAPIALTGEVRFDERLVAHLASRTDGVIRKVHVQIGDLVDAGQPLVEVDSLEQGDAQGEYLSARAARALADRTNARQQALRRDGISSERETLEASQALEAADIRVRSASERLLRLGLERADMLALGRSSHLGTAQGRLVLRAPMVGRVMDMHAVAGEAAKAGETLIMVGRTDPVRVFADLYENHLAQVQALLNDGPAPAVITVKAFSDRRFPGTLDLLGSVMDRDSRTVKARVTVPNPNGALRPGMFAEVHVGLPGGERAVVVPRTAVLHDEGRAFVFVPHLGDYWVRRPVDTGREWDGWVEITGGLEAGRQVATDGAFLLKSDVLRSKMGAGCAD